jgi:hypothetical protein
MKKNKIYEETIKDLRLEVCQFRSFFLLYTFFILLNGFLSLNLSFEFGLIIKTILYISVYSLLFLVLIRVIIWDVIAIIKFRNSKLISITFLIYFLISICFFLIIIENLRKESIIEDYGNFQIMKEPFYYFYHCPNDVRFNNELRYSIPYPISTSLAPCECGNGIIDCNENAIIDCKDGVVYKNFINGTYSGKTYLCNESEEWFK